jgi:hypothetical protein
MARPPATPQARLARQHARRWQRGLAVRILTSLLGAACAGAGLVALATWWAAGLALLFASPAQAQVQSQVQSQVQAAAPRPPQATTSMTLHTPGDRPVRPAGPRPELADPTRPPGLGGAGRTTPDPGGSPGPATRPGLATPAVRPPSPPPPLLQALHLPRSGPPSALIDGQVLQVGDRQAGWTVQAIRADGVLLARPAPCPSTPRGAASTRPAATATACAATSPSAPPPPTLWLSLLPPLAGGSPAATRP